MRRRQSIDKVFSADEAIDRLGGPREFGELLGAFGGLGRPIDERVVWNWRKRGFPAHRYREIASLLISKRLRFSPDALFARMGNGR